MEPKQKKLALIFAMFFIATLIVTAIFNLNAGGIEGKAIQEFNSAKENVSFCDKSCDEKMEQEKPEYDSWISCHENCMNN